MTLFITELTNIFCQVPELIQILSVHFAELQSQLLVDCLSFLQSLCNGERLPCVRLRLHLRVCFLIHCQGLITLLHLWKTILLIVRSKYLEVFMIV